MKAAWTFRSPDELRATYGPGGARKPALAQEHSATSRAAAQAVEPQRGRLAAVVLENLVAAGEWGQTDEEGINRTGIPASTYRPRRIELVEANRVYDSGRTRLTRSRRAAVVWIAR